MNRGTFEGDIAEIEFVKKFNKDKSNVNFDFYIKDCEIEKIEDIYMVRVTTKQYSKLSQQTVMTRADAYLIKSKDELLKKILFENEYYLDEEILFNNKIEYNYLNYSGISVKMSDSTNFQILKLTPESFNTLFGEYELGAGASVFCLREDEIEKNNSVFAGWHTSKDKVIDRYIEDVPELGLLRQKITVASQMDIYKKLKDFSNKRIKEIIDNNHVIKKTIFNGYYIYEEPYTASYFYKGEQIQKLEYIPFTITTGSGRSKGIFTIVLKPKNETND